ncbi:hypothetical protein [Brevundimonas sp.]|uniref:hypothetical protein n=1 Tax=Brevundimonas sp. TaxID=1871086 RepID=UPI003A912BC0
MTRLLFVIALGVSQASCGSEDGIAGYQELERQVERERVGADPDQWIEMRNLMGEWERTGLIFGYGGDYDECLKAIAGLKQANEGREYRCVPAN